LFSDPNKHINTMSGQSVELLNVKSGGTYSDHWAVKRLLMEKKLIGVNCVNHLKLNLEIFRLI